MKRVKSCGDCIHRHVCRYLKEYGPTLLPIATQICMETKSEAMKGGTRISYKKMHEMLAANCSFFSGNNKTEKC
jgi:hypothetical protein